MTARSDADQVIADTRCWLERAVIGLNLCPFARNPFVEERICYRVSGARTEDALVADLDVELRQLRAADPKSIETTLLIHPYVLADFGDYNDFLDIAEATLEALELTEHIQIASFHPLYQFADTRADDVENCTNRSPYPMLHLLRQTSIDRAIAAMPDTASIYRANIATLEQLGAEGWRRLWSKA